MSEMKLKKLILREGKAFICFNVIGIGPLIIFEIRLKIFALSPRDYQFWGCNVINKDWSNIKKM